MKENIDTVLLGHRTVLVPYRRRHVPKYHEWMLDAELRDLTASECLTLGEEYDMQQKWQNDEDKLTFIILGRHPEDQLPSVHDPQALATPLSPEDPRIVALPMVGDVNLFLKGTRPELLALREGTIVAEEDSFEAEIEIMIAERTYRQKGLAIESILLLLSYATGQGSGFLYPFLSHPPSDARPPAHWNLQPYLEHIQTTQSPRSLTSIVAPNRLVTRISQSNEPSIRLFEKLGFKIVKKVEVFQEVEMRCQYTERVQDLNHV